MQQLMAGVYFKASEIVDTLDEYGGRKGRFVKTFGLNDKRNKNGWRAVWEGIQRNIKSFKDRPGIEFEKCDANGCDLDHTEAQTKELSIEVQEPFRKTTIIDWPLDEANRVGYFIHEVHDDETWDKIKSGVLKFVSPSIWPKSGGYEVIGTMENGLPMIDVWDWDGLHDAFVNKPAFGDDAKITAACEGVDCPVKLLSAKEMGKTEIQTVIIDKDRFELDEAKKWLQEHDFKVPAVDETEESYRFRQKEPSLFQDKSFRTIELSDGVKAVIGKPKNASAMKANDRPPKAWFDECVSDSQKFADNPEAFCNWRWHKFGAAKIDLDKLSAIAGTDSNFQNNIQHLQEIPLSIMHNNKKRFISVTKTAYAAVQALLKAGETPDESKVFEIIRKDKQNTSFSSCTCSGNHKMPTEEENLKASLKAMEDEKKELESKLKGAEDEEKKDMEARKARLVATLKAQTEEEREKTAKSIRGNTDEKEKVALEEAEKDVKTAKKGTTDDPDKPSSAMEEENKDMKARIIELENDEAKPLVASMVLARETKGATPEDVTAFTASMEEKSLKEIKALYANEKIFIEGVLEAAEVPEKKHFNFGPNKQGAMSAKSMDEIFQEVPPNAS